METIACVACRGTRHALVAVSGDMVHGLAGEWHVVRCLECGLMFTNPRPGPNEIGAYYPSDYGPHEAPGAGDGATGGRRAIARRLRRRLKELYGGVVIPDLPPGARVLDVGCATGGFLATLRERRWQLHGVEVAEEPARLARSRYGLDVFCGTLDAARFTTGTFDAVFCFHTLEHLHDPLTALREIRRITAPGGYFIASIPNGASLGFRVFRDRWFGLELPRHLFHFTPRTLGALLRDAGFVVERVTYSWGIYCSVASVGLFLRELPLARRLGHWLVHDYPRHRGAFRWLVCTPIGAILSLTRQADVFSVVARARER